MNKPVDWISHSQKAADAVEIAWTRIRDVRALLLAINDAELLSDIPSDASARARHAAGICLLSILERELEGMQETLEAAGLEP